MQNGTTTMPQEKTRLELARERKEARDLEAKAAAEAQELALLELEEDCIAKYGKRGVDWEIVDAAPVALFVVVKPDFIVAKKFTAAEKKGEEEAIHFVLPSIKSPDTMSARQMFIEHGGLAWRCAHACLALYEVGGADKRGKY